jgi:hypothetical protein
LGLPPLPPHFHRQYKRNPRRCQRTTVFGRTIAIDPTIFGHTLAHPFRQQVGVRQDDLTSVAYQPRIDTGIRGQKLDRTKIEAPRDGDKGILLGGRLAYQVADQVLGPRVPSLCREDDRKG